MHACMCVKIYIESLKLFGNLHSITNLIKVDPRHLFSSASKNLQKPGAFTSYPKFVRRPMSANSAIQEALPSALSFIEICKVWLVPEETVWQLLQTRIVTSLASGRPLVSLSLSYLLDPHCLEKFSKPRIRTLADTHTHTHKVFMYSTYPHPDCKKTGQVGTRPQKIIHSRGLRSPANAAGHFCIYVYIHPPMIDIFMMCH